MRKVRVCAELCKMRVSLFSVLSAATGFFLASSGMRGTVLPLILGTFFLACGACALNEYQERDVDARMPRTGNRPLPSGRISPLHALFFSLTCIALGMLTLLLTGCTPAALLGLLALVWYNGVYTPLKKRTAFALIPGSLVGMLPPAMGWVAGDGLLTDPGLRALSFFFFMWQVPHFWLLLLGHGEEYEKAGLPSLTGIFTRAQLSRIIFAWILAAAVSCLLLPAAGMIHAPLAALFLSGASFWLMWRGMMLLRLERGESSFPVTFGTINTYMLLVMVLLSVDKLFT